MLGQEGAHMMRWIPAWFALVFLLMTPGSPGAQTHDAQGWFAEGNRLLSEGRYEEAAQAFEQSIEQNPKSPAAFYNLGIANKKLGNPEGAANAFEATLKLEPSNLDARLSLGNIYNLMERWEEAIGELNIVVHRRRNDAEAHGNLGWAYYNYHSGPPFKLLVIANLRKAVELFELQGKLEAAQATRDVLDEAEKKFAVESAD